MNKKLVIITFVILTFLLILGIFLYVSRSGNRNELILYGNVDIRQVDLGFRVFGRVEEMFFDEGQFVQIGQLLAELEKTPQIEEVRQAEAKVATVEASLEKAKWVLKRRESAVKTGAVSQENFDDAYYNALELEASLKEAKASLDSAKTHYNDTQVFSPSTGTILTRVREPGAVVNVGEPVYTLSIASPVWIRTYISEPELGLIYQGMEAEVTTDTEGLKPYIGHIGFISPVAEFTPKSVETTKLRTDLVYRLRVVVDNPDQFLKQGMPVTVHIRL